MKSGIQNRQADIIVLDLKDKGLIFDLTIRWEANNTNQDKEMNEEKRNIYLKTIVYLKCQYSIKDWDVKDYQLWFSARGIAYNLYGTSSKLVCLVKKT